MSSTTTVTDWSDLYTALLQDMRTNTGASVTTALAKRYIDEAHFKLYIAHGEKFHWAERRAFIKTHAEYTTGTVAVTIGSGTVTGTDTLWNTNNDHGQPNARENGKLVIGGESTVYTVSAVASDTSLTISPEWIGATDSELTYRYYEDEYSLASDFAKPLDARSFDDGETIRLIGRTDFRRLFPRNWITSQSIRAAIIEDSPPDGDTTPIRRVRFGPPPSNTQVVPYSYVTRNIVTASDGTAKESFTADADEPIMPLRYRSLILSAAKVAWYRDLKDDQRSIETAAELAGGIERIVGDQDIGAQRMRLRGVHGAYRARARSPYRGSRRYDTNGRFDRFEDG